MRGPHVLCCLSPRSAPRNRQWKPRPSASAARGALRCSATSPAAAYAGRAGTTSPRAQTSHARNCRSVRAGARRRTERALLTSLGADFLARVRPRRSARRLGTSAVVRHNAEGGPVGVSAYGPSPLKRIRRRRTPDRGWRRRQGLVPPCPLLSFVAPRLRGVPIRRVPKRPTRNGTSIQTIPVSSTRTRSDSEIFFP